MKIAIGCDHNGLALKEALLKSALQGHSVRDFGVFGPESVDYPDIAFMVAQAVASGDCERGILICGTGIGMAIAANKVKGVRAAACSDVYSAKMSRRDNDANVLCLGGRVVGPGLAAELVTTWLNESFEGGRHQRRVEKIRQREEERPR
ncbi:MAG: ribose 5-phosphate isomerase B [Candidatus Bipolaricaulota bacterium]|nr:ribose 5-phosphate isomerase B [Candidatus Bipolaricaulota bacterium]MCS7274306.1 ribose 5-phosphate isomerase B [Candidatus Bipolaricaulota bacterium]MDW8111443.1 ribose 5-phosphate isomerase B [Candidatus Bipolaricaulota bacterium]MDW8329736.1 ribose 5-phosphate isomerase B [Candidatus Bipolaricaulota bacterium]